MEYNQGVRHIKLPGLVCFNVTLIEHRWQIVMIDIIGLFINSMKKEAFQKSLNATIICLLPEVVRAKVIKAWGRGATKG